MRSKKVEDKAASALTQRRIQELSTKYAVALKNIEVSKQTSEYVFNQLRDEALKRDRAYQSALLENQEANRKQAEADLEYDRLRREKKIEVIRQESLSDDKVSFFDKALRKGISDYSISIKGRVDFLEIKNQVDSSFEMYLQARKNLRSSFSNRTDSELLKNNYVQAKDKLFSLLKGRSLNIINEAENSILMGHPIMAEFKLAAETSTIENEKRNKTETDLVKAKQNVEKQVYRDEKFIDVQRKKYVGNIQLYRNLLADHALPSYSREKWNSLRDFISPFLEEISKTDTDKAKALQTLKRDIMESKMIHDGTINEMKIKDVTVEELKPILGVLVEDDQYKNMSVDDQCKLIEMNYFQFFYNVSLIEDLYKYQKMEQIIKEHKLIKLFNSPNYLGNLDYKKIDEKEIVKIKALLKHPVDKVELNKALSEVGIRLPSSELDKVKKQVYYQQLLPESIRKNLAEDAIIKGKKTGIMRTTDTQGKIRTLNDFIKQCTFKPAKADVEKRQLLVHLNNLGLTMDVNMVYESLNPAKSSPDAVSSVLLPAATDAISNRTVTVSPTTAPTSTLAVDDEEKVARYRVMPEEPVLSSVPEPIHFTVSWPKSKAEPEKSPLADLVSFTVAWPKDAEKAIKAATKLLQIPIPVHNIDAELMRLQSSLSSMGKETKNLQGKVIYITQIIQQLNTLKNDTFFSRMQVEIETAITDVSGIPERLINADEKAALLKNLNAFLSEIHEKNKIYQAQLTEKAPILSAFEHELREQLRLIFYPLQASIDEIKASYMSLQSDFETIKSRTVDMNIVAVTAMESEFSKIQTQQASLHQRCQEKQNEIDKSITYLKGKSDFTLEYSELLFESASRQLALIKDLADRNIQEVVQIKLIALNQIKATLLRSGVAASTEKKLDITSVRLLLERLEITLANLSERYLLTDKNTRLIKDNLLLEKSKVEKWIPILEATVAPPELQARARRVLSEINRKLELLNPVTVTFHRQVRPRLGPK